MKTMRKKIGAIMVGLIVILVGVGFAAKNMGYEFDPSSLLFDGWWTVFIIVPGVLMLFEKNSNKVFAVVVIAVGMALLLSQLIHLNIWGWIAPAAIIAVGVSIAAGAFKDRNDKKDDKGDDDNKDDAE